MYRFLYRLARWITSYNIRQRKGRKELFLLVSVGLSCNIMQHQASGWYLRPEQKRMGKTCSRKPLRVVLFILYRHRYRQACAG